MLDKLKRIVVVMMGLPRGPAPGGATREPVRRPRSFGPMCTGPRTSSPLIRPRASSLAGSRVRVTVTCTSKSASRRRNGSSCHPVVKIEPLNPGECARGPR